MCSLGADEQTSVRHEDDDQLLPLRSAVILLAALFISAVAGILTFAGSRQPAQSVLAAGGAFLATTVFCNNTMISRRP